MNKLLTTPKMFLIVILIQVQVSMIQAPETYMDAFAGQHCMQYDFMISSDYWNRWNSSRIEKNCSTAAVMFCDHEEEWCAPVIDLHADADICTIHMLDDIQRLGFVYQTNTYLKRPHIFYAEQVDSEAVGSEYYSQQFKLTCTEGGVLCVMITGFLLCCIIKLHIHDGTFLGDNLKKLLFPKDTVKEINGCRADYQLSESSRDENTDIESFSNCNWLPKRLISRLCKVQPFQYVGKEDSAMDQHILEERKTHGIVADTTHTFVCTGYGVKSLRIEQETVEVTFQKPAKAEVKDLGINAETLKITAQTSDGSEVQHVLVKIGTVDITAQASGGTKVKDLEVKKGSWEVAAQASVVIEVENLRVNEGTEKFTAKASSSTIEEDLTGKEENIEVIAKANDQAEVSMFRTFEEFGKTTMESSHQEEVENCRATCQAIGNEEELGSYDDTVPSDELVNEQYFVDGVKIDDLNQPFLQATCKSVEDKNADRRNDLCCYQDIHKERKQQNESGKILELVKMKKKQSFRAKGSDARDRIVTTTASQEWLKKNPDSDINLSFRDSGLSEEHKIAPCLQEHRKWPKSHPSVSGAQQEFTPVTSTEESVLISMEEPFNASPQKCKVRNANNSDNLSIITEIPPDFISLESEKKKKALCSKLHFGITDNPLSFVSLKNNKKSADDNIHFFKEGVKFCCRKQVISSTVGAFFETEDTSLDQKKDSGETEQQIPSDMDVTVQKDMFGVEIDQGTVTDIDLQEKKKHHLRQIVWLPRNWLPLPRLGRDIIAGFVEEQTRDQHGGSSLPPAEHEELREMLRQLASDNIPGPQITMKYEMLRLCTMKSFPGQDRPFAIRIIGAGFYYAGHQDQVICYCCGNRKDSWVLGDIPLLIHQKMAPDCGFLTHKSLVNVPIRMANSADSPSLAEVRLLAIQRSDGANQSDTAQGESSLMLPSSEQNRVNISNMSHQMLVTNKSSTPDQLMASGRQNVLDNLQTVSAHTDSVEEPPPKYPQYAVKNMRMNSFQGWPAELQQKPDEMAECGFYYAGFSDCVRCFFCGVGLRHWMSEDDPWIEHARWSTSCIYVLKMKGEEFVSLVKMAVEIAEREEAARNNGGGNQAPQNSNEAAPAVTAKEVASNNSSTTNSMASKDITSSTGVTGDNGIGAATSTPSPGNTEIQKYLLTDAAQSVLDMGYQPKLVLRAIERVLLKKGTEELTGQIIMEAVFEIEEETKAQPQPQTFTQSAEGNESSGKAKMNSEASNKQDGQLSAEATEIASLEESQIDPEKIMREHRELREATLCKICMENTISVVFLPCGHLVTCPDCAPAMRKCPICRTLIKGTVKTFYG